MKIVGSVLATMVLAGATNATSRTFSADATPRATLEKLFAALNDSDRATFDRITTPDFRAFEGGHILNRESFFGLVQSARQRGDHFVWSVTDERVATGGDVAVMNYVNRGSIGTAEKRQPMSWLEVATFRRVDGSWRVNFVESQRVAQAGAR